MVNQVSVLCSYESRMFSRGAIKRSSSEPDFDIEDFLSKGIVGPEENDSNKANNVVAVSASEPFQERFVPFGDDCSAASLTNREIKTVLSRQGIFSEPLWSQNYTHKHSSISGAIDSQSSVCVGSPGSANQPTGQSNQGANSRSSREQSDDEDIEIELGQCEQSSDPVNLKRQRRKISNRNSARRSRQRKQAHLTELESQVLNLQEENASLFKHLTDASQQYRDANTNNRVLKSGVEALRAKVELAEDMIARGSLTHTLNQLVQNHFGETTGPNVVGAMSNVSPTINLHGDGLSYAGPMTSGHMSNTIENLNCSMGNNDDLSDLWG